MQKMDLDRFCKFHQLMMKETPNLFEINSPDPPANENQLQTVERAVGFIFPKNYRNFLIKFGGGAFGLTTIFSANEASEYYILNQNHSLNALIPIGYIPFSDDYCGGWYVISISDDNNQESVFYWSHEEGLLNTEFSSIFEFLETYAYKSA